MHRFSIFLVVFLFVGLKFGITQNIWEGYEHLFKPVRSYVAYQSLAEINIDGIANEPSWGDAEWSGGFLDIEGAHKPKPLHDIRIKMLWDEEQLYILAELEEPHLWATYSKHDQIVYHENDFEIFIDPDGNTHDYFEFELNALNTLFDLFLPMSYKAGGRPLIIWDAPGFQSAVQIEGTLNDATDVDKKWTIEIAIPFYALRSGMHSVVPDDGTTWKINFSRVEWQTEVVDGKYQKKKNKKTGKYIPEYNWVWSPQGVINMHLPERWGMIQFSKKRVNEDPVSFQLPFDEELKKYLWLVYYKQNKFAAENGAYAKKMEQLGIPKKVKLQTGEEAQIEMFSSKVQFTAFLKTNKGITLSINDKGLYQKNK